MHRGRASASVPPRAGSRRRTPRPAAAVERARRGASRSSSSAARTRAANGARIGTVGPRRRGDEAVQQRGAVLDVGVVPLEPAAVVVLQQREPDRPRVGHSCSRSLMNTRLPSDFDIFSPSYATIAECIQWRTNGSPGGRLALRDLALVVREDQVGAAAVQVDRRAELPQRQRRALDVPARAGPTPNSAPTPARRRATAATARSRAGRACAGRRGCRRVPAARRSIWSSE